MKALFLALIWLYRWTISPLIGSHCRFYPTCSHYAEEAIHKHGPLKGLWISLRRLSRCHPWNRRNLGGPDPVP